MDYYWIELLLAVVVLVQGSIYFTKEYKKIKGV